jgi:REP element-mobilizing transposase RayT
MKYDPAKHNRRSIRLKGYDYSGEGAYHVVIRTKNGVCMFGEVEANETKLSPIGGIAERCWLEIPEHFPYVELDQYVVMPNHLHGIVIIVGRKEADISRKDVQLNVLTSTTLPKNAVTGRSLKPTSQISPHKGTLSVIVRTYKAAVTTMCRKQGFQTFGWHGRFYDHIVRDGADLDRIRQYILDNPINWTNDDNFPSNIRMNHTHEGTTD